MKLQWLMILAGVFCGVALGMAGAEPERGRLAQGREGSRSLDSQLAGGGARRSVAGASFSEWQWETQRFVNVGSAEPAQLTETVLVRFANRGESLVRVTFRATAEPGFPAGSFRGRKEVSFTMERAYERVVARGKRFLARPAGAFRLAESDPAGHTLADFSTLGGIARGKNLVMVVGEAFSGENLFAADGANLGFVNQQFAGDNARAFPREIVLEPLK